MPRPGRGRRKKQKQSTSPLRGVKREEPSRLSSQQIKQCGVLAWGGSTRPVLGKLQVTHGKLSLPYALTLLWKPGLKIDYQAAMRGFTRLCSPRDLRQAWEILAMLVDQNLLASVVGSEKERAWTLDEVGDLRLPVYDVRVLWVRRTGATERVVARWASEVEQGADEQHAFLRALYAERAMLCTLPPAWFTS